MLKRCFCRDLPSVCTGGAARWIAPEEAVPDRAGCFICRCRAVFSRAEVLRLHLAADSVYRLYIDGVFAAEGAELGDKQIRFVDSLEWEASAGEHRLVAIVPFFGPKGPWARMDAAPGFFCAAEGRGAEQLASCSANWQTADAPMFRWQAPFGWVTPVGEELIFDASASPDGIWRGADRVCDWRSAAERSDSGRRLQPATLPDMLRKPVKNFRVLYAGPHRDKQFHGADNDEAAAAEAERKLRSGEVLTFPPHVERKLLIALEDYCCIRPELTVSGGRGASVSLGWAEGLFRNDAELGEKEDRRRWRDRYFIGLYDHFLCDGRSGMEFFTFSSRSGRYLSLEVKSGSEPLTIDALRLPEHRYPLRLEAAFACADRRFEDLARRCRRTLEMCSHDTFMDCPYYERLMYVGDTRIQALLTLAGSRDSRLVEKALHLIAAGQLPSGFVPSRYPSRPPQEIPLYTPFFIGMVTDYARWRGGTLPRELLPVVLRCAEAFEPFRNRYGLVEFHRGWNFVDWVPAWKTGTPPHGDDGVSGLVNAHVLYGFKECADLCGLLGEKTLELQWRNRLSDAMRVFVETFWDESAGAFRNSADDPLLSEHLQILALLTGALPDAVRTRCARTLCSGTLPIRTTSYFDFYLFETYALLGRGDLVLRRLEDVFDQEKLGLRTMPEQPEPSRSDCHAWSAHPLYHCWTTLLGVRPAGFGFREVEIRIPVGAPEFMRGSVVHPAGGSIEVECTPEEVHLHLPCGLSGRLHLPGGEVRNLHNGDNRILRKNPADVALFS